MIEIEVKLRVGEAKAARERVLALGAVVVRERHLERNVLFDFAAGTLREGRRALRLRTTGRRATLTFKGEPRKSRSFKVREEFETQVRDPGQARRILRALGLRETVAYEKRRTVFRKARLTVALDETAAGNFIELEGERHEIVRFAKALGFGRADFVTASYVDLLTGGGKTAGPA
ncbi:MAG TPA: class IV adenylate cyclase [Candidatus Aminicenantes bacterium]|nr:class IV adenylate cyclase [Candidatus Aminicenantes bacterium]